MLHLKATDKYAANASLNVIIVWVNIYVIEEQQTQHSVAILMNRVIPAVMLDCFFK